MRLRTIAGAMLAALCMPAAAAPIAVERSLVQEHGVLPVPAAAEDSLTTAQYREIWEAIA
jgi:hypothetical protein